MAGELVPLVLIPRYTTYCGGNATEFVTIGMDVTQYQKAILQVWRGAIAGTSPDFNLSCQESSDQVNWTACAGTNVTDYDPTADTEGQAEATITKRWFRVKLTLSATETDNVVTCWVVGFLEERLS